MAIASNRYALREGGLAPPSATPVAPAPLGEENAQEGFLHSYETGGTLDGPGIRFVLFLTGCELRCQYCHNPDTWRARNGRRVSAETVLKEIGKYERFLREYKGGVTISGGEPLTQYRFVRQLLRGCKALGLHSALDTNGYLGDRLSDADLADIDLVLLDLKAFDSALHTRVTGVNNRPILDFARRLSDLQRPAWIRFVLVPGLTDNRADIRSLASFVGELQNVERVEVLPFHKMGEYKWRELGLKYQLTDTLPPGPELLEWTRAEFRRYGPTVY